MKRLLHEPLLHFLLLGALLFGLYGWLNRSALQSPNEVVVDQARVAALSTQFERIWQRKPTTIERQGLIDRWVREEIIYREGLAAGMERDDEVVRRRVVQKMSFLADGMAAEASEADLQDWLSRHPDDYSVGPTYTLRQVYFDPARRGDQLDSAIPSAVAALERNPQARVGDATMLPSTLNQVSADDITRAFGREFTEALARLPSGRWVGPVMSGFGMHLVRIDIRTPGRIPALPDVRQAVERDLAHARSREASDAYYQALRKRYTVKVEAGPIGAAIDAQAAVRPGQAFAVTGVQ